MLNRESFISHLQWFILLALFAYDGFTYLPEESNFALYKSIYYVFIFIAFLLVCTLQINHGHLMHRYLGSISYAIQIYFWLYLVRLFYDFMIVGVDQEIVTNPFTAIFLYVNAAIIPFYGFYVFKWNLIDLKKLNTAMLGIFLIMGMVSMWYIFTGKAASEYLGDDGRFMGNASMDTIAFGHLGTSITILGLSLLYQANIRFLHKILGAFAILSGLFITLAAGSRGAIVALLLCFVAYLYMNGHKLKILIGLPVLAAIFIALLPILRDILASYGNLALDRLYNSIYAPDSMEAGVTSGRDVLYDQAWKNILQSPILGSSLYIGGEYVHNSILESFLGLGIIGGLLFTIIILRTLGIAFRMAEEDKGCLFVSLLFVQYLSYSLFSRTLSMLPLFWMSLYLVIFLNARKNDLTA